jgi:hypothetical protein
MVQGDTERPTHFIDNEEFEVVDQFTYLGSSVKNNLSLDQEINIRIWKAATAINRLRKRVRDNTKLTIKTKTKTFCFLSTLLYGSETWSTYMYYERRLNSFHMRCLRGMWGIRWQDKISNNYVLEKADITTVFFMLSLRRLRWLWHTKRMEDGRMPTDLIYGELKIGKRSQGRPLFQYKNVCKLDM